MEECGAHIVGVALQGLHASLGLVVPDLDQLIVCPTYQVWLVPYSNVLKLIPNSRASRTIVTSPHLIY